MHLEIYAILKAIMASQVIIIIIVRPRNSRLQVVSSWLGFGQCTRCHPLRHAYLGQSIPGLGWKRTFVVSLGFQGGLGVGGSYKAQMLVGSITLNRPFHGFFQFFSLWTSLEKSINSSGNKNAFKLGKLSSLKVICFQVFQASRKLRWSARHAQWGKTQKKYFKLLLLLLLLQIIFSAPSFIVCVMHSMSAFCSPEKHKKIAPAGYIQIRGVST